jgi:hypothetical protein
MNPRLFPIAALTVWMAPTPAKAQTAGAFEAFTYQTNADSWEVFDYADEQVYAPQWDSAGGGMNPNIHFTFAGGNPLEFRAEASSSGGAFTGNLAAAGVDAVGCKFFVQDAASFDVGEFFLISSVTGQTYTSVFIEAEGSGWNDARVSLTRENWYVFENGGYVAVPLTPAILSGITRIGLTFYPLDIPAADGKRVGMDNFTFYGALVLPEVTTSAGGSSFQLTFNRRPGIGYSVLSAPDLATWEPVPGEEFITGTSPYTMTRPLAPGSHFFKVGIEDFLTPVPEMSAP